MAHCITNMGGVWKLSDRAYRKLTRDIANGVLVDLDDYGPMLCTESERLDDLLGVARPSREED